MCPLPFPVSIVKRYTEAPYVSTIDVLYGFIIHFPFRDFLQLHILSFVMKMAILVHQEISLEDHQLMHLGEQIKALSVLALHAGQCCLDTRLCMSVSECGKSTADSFPNTACLYLILSCSHLLCT